MLHFANSTPTAQYVAASMARDAETLSGSKLSEVGILKPTTDLYEDNHAATMILKTSRVDHKTK
jgi:hypothetical protein